MHPYVASREGPAESVVYSAQSCIESQDTSVPSVGTLCNNDTLLCAEIADHLKMQQKCFDNEFTGSLKPGRTIMS